MLKLLLIFSLISCSLYARPQSGTTTGEAVAIRSLGIKLAPPKGMKIILAGETEAVNYHFPWFQGESGIINIATIPNTKEDEDLTKAFTNHSSQMKGAIKFTGYTKAIDLPSGIPAIEAHFLGKDETRIKRLYFKNSSGSPCYIHLIPTKRDLQLITSITTSLSLIN
ncbi:hypothetical protein ACFPK9_00725 [Rubritalea spongiae]|uniref:Uncharacterized protein n=1 Tax=Rubritalea spongiae TaxID=430797 RepID=A0ABW5E4R5_9BACT